MNNSRPDMTTPLSLAERHERNLAAFINHLKQHRLWHILPPGSTNLDKAIGLFDSHTNRYIPPLTHLRAFLEQPPFAHVRHQSTKKRLGTLHNKTRLFWNNDGSDEEHLHAEGKQKLLESDAGDIASWRLPTKDMLQTFATDDANPYRKGKEHRLAKESGEDQPYWLTAGGICDVDKGYWSISTDEKQKGSIFACSLHWQDAAEITLLVDLINHDWELVATQAAATPPGKIIFPFLPIVRIMGTQFSEIMGRADPETEEVFPPPAPAIECLDTEQLLATWVSERYTLRAASHDSMVLNPKDYWVDMQLAELDYTPCRLPKLDSTQLTDPEKGLWELWGYPPSRPPRFGYVARDPLDDVQRRAVAIDFGTSSTVVAMDTINGARELLRIGVRDFYETVQAGHFENPTVLECLDFAAFNNAWTAKAYRPALNWDWMRAAHEAQASLRDNPGDTTILASILPRLKQWALRSTENRRVRLSDRQGSEMELPAHSERNPVRGQALTVSPDEPFDPIELYAWYLGMAINWRGRGLFLKYHLSFPVKYPREVKARILASFRRGLQRSLPETLIQHHPQVLNEFEVTDLASEPAAYAAAALPHLGVEPTEEGVPYAVFDFGGGTSDFDYGLLRWATPAEESQGYERVFEHLSSEGDNFLGGENLLEHLVYESFKHNLSVLRENRIQFTQPIDAQPFAGSEAFLASTQAAQTNTVMLASKLRNFLEQSEATLAPQLKLDLIDANGSKQTCELILDAQMLDGLLAQRIRQGVEAFLAGLARLQSELPPDAPIQVLLAGNGSRSRHITTLFDTDGAPWQELLAQTFGQAQEDWDGKVPTLVVHPPLPMDEEHPHAPTSKTGVALGLLRLAPGENTLLKNRLHSINDGQAPFGWFAGRLRRGRFEPVLVPNIAYGEWQELGPLQQGAFNLYFSSSPRAHTGLSEGSSELKKHGLSFPAAAPGARLFARAMKPDLLELSAALDAAAIEDASSISFLLE